MTRVLLTGATGLVGAPVLRRLLDRGHAVRVLALPETVGLLPSHPALEVVQGGLDDDAALALAARGARVAYHLAGRVPGSAAAELHAVNVQGTAGLLEACARAGVRRFVYASSTAVYAPAEDPRLWPIREDRPLRAAGSRRMRSYARSKIEGERLVRRAAAASGMEHVIVRPTAAYGRGAPSITGLLERLEREPWRALGPAAGKFRMQWVHVDDLADGVVRAGMRPAAAGKAINLAGPEVFGLATLVRALRGAPPGPAYGRAAGTQKYDLRRARRLLGYVPRVGIDEGLADVVAGLPGPAEDAPPRARPRPWTAAGVDRGRP